VSTKQSLWRRKRRRQWFFGRKCQKYARTES
jgi:hypothetical protein